MTEPLAVVLASMEAVLPTVVLGTGKILFVDQFSNRSLVPRRRRGGGGG
jgi:hypothetical protein